MVRAEKTKRIAQWIIAAFLVIGALVYFPSITSGIFVVAAVAAAPIPKLRALLASVGVRGWKLGLIAALLFVGGCVLAPVSESAAPPATSEGDPSGSVILSEIDEEDVALDRSIEVSDTSSVSSAETTGDPAASSDPESEAADPDVQDVSSAGGNQTTQPADPAPEETPTPQTVEPEPESEPEAELELEAQEIMVYVTASGDKYHRSSCRYLTDSQQEISLSSALGQGYEPCKVCNPPTE